jgi:heat shock protein HtpX
MFDQIRANQRRTAILVVGMAGLLLGLGYALAELWSPGFGAAGLVLAFFVWVILTVISYYNGDSIFLGVSKARKIEKSDHPVLWNVVEEMCVASGISRIPDIYIIDDPALNAFATGRDVQHASVAVTAGLLNELTRDELQGVIAHELGHVRNRDILYMMMAGIMLGAIVLLAEMGRQFFRFGAYTRTTPRRSSRNDGAGQLQLILLVLAVLLIILAPVLARLLYLALSRRREYLADASSALYTRYPDGLASALEKIGSSSVRLRTASDVTAPMFIANPLKVSAGGLADLTSTHPPLSERIRILRSMGTSGSLREYEDSFRKVTGRAVGLVPFSELPATDVAQAAPPAPLPIPGVPGLPGFGPVAAAVADTTATAHVERVRQTTDALWKLNDYSLVECPCDTRLKVPPVFRGQTISCPHCGRDHAIAA